MSSLVGTYTARITPHDLAISGERWRKALFDSVYEQLIHVSGVFNTPAGEIEEIEDHTTDSLVLQAAFNADAWTGKGYKRHDAAWRDQWGRRHGS